ncbi:MAG TPA: ABC transporter ATP-binding protein [Lachnospiraceae bacterium]|nr:ABC transporter ATP-binding protein [Lachnospiraceae bacterium]
MVFDMKKNTVGRTLYYYGRAVMKHWPFFILGIAASFGYTYCLTFLNAIAVSNIIDKVSSATVSADNVILYFLPDILMLVGANVIGQICSKLQDYSVWKLEILVYYDLSTLVFDRLSNQSMTFHNSRFGGSLVSQTSKFTGAFAQLINLFMYAIVPLVSATVLTIVLLAPLVPVYVVILSIILVIYVVVVWRLFRRSLPLNNEAAKAQNTLSGVLSDAITNIMAVKTSGRESFEKEHFTRVNKEVRAADSKRMHATLLSASVAAGIIVVIMVVQTVFVAGGNAWYGISAGTLVMIFSYTHNLTLRFNMLNSNMITINRAFGDASEMTVNLDEPLLVDDADDAVELKVTDGEIAFENLVFYYTDGVTEDGEVLDDEAYSDSTSETGEDEVYSDSTSKSGEDEGNKRWGDNVFNDFSMTIHGGERVGLVGESGSGKTTLTKLLLRLADIQEGAIRIDGQDISKVTQVSLRKQIAYVPQEPLLFHRTIAENISYGRPDASMDEIIKAAKEANAYNFIQKLPKGFDTVTGERGVKLSGGQKQRVAIARAILTDAPILVLDEATSALDSESERLIQEALANLMKDRTSIVIAHRLSTVASLDRIVVLKDGKITESGTHDDLISKDGEYAKLWERQTNAFKVI